MDKEHSKKKFQSLVASIGFKLKLDFGAVLNLIELRRGEESYTIRANNMFEKIERLSYFSSTNFNLDVLQKLNDFLHSDPEFLQAVSIRIDNFGYRLNDDFILFMRDLYTYLENHPKCLSQEILAEYYNNTLL